MKRADVELVLLKSFDYWKSLLGNEIDLWEIQELTEEIWESIQEDKEIDEAIHCVYVISRSNIQRLVMKGKTSFTDIYGNRITLRFEDCGDAPCMLESGTIYLSKEHFMENEADKKQKEKEKQLLNGIISEEKCMKKQTCLEEFMNPGKDTKVEKMRGKKND